MPDRIAEKLQRKYDELRIKIEAQKLKRLQKYKEKAERKDAREAEAKDREMDIQLAAEKDVFGEPLTAEQRLEFEEFRQRRKEEIRQKIERAKRGFSKARQAASAVGDKASRIAEEADDILGGEFQKVPTGGFNRGGYDVADGQSRPVNDNLEKMFSISPPKVSGPVLRNTVLPKQRDPMFDPLPADDPLKKFYSIEPAKQARKTKPSGGFSKGFDVGDLAGGIVDTTGNFGTMFKKPKRQKGLYDDMLYQP